MSNKRFVLRLKRSPEKIHMAAVAAFLTVLCLPFHTLSIGGVGLLMLTGIPLLMLSIPAFLRQFRSNRWDKALLLLLAFFLYNLAAYIWTPTFSMDSVYTYVKIIVVVLSLYCIDLNSREKRLLLIAAVFVGLLVCWFIITGRNIYYHEGRAFLSLFGITQDPNYMGYLFLIPMAVGVAGLFESHTLGGKIAYGAIAVVVLFAVLLTGSRGALLGLIAVAGVCALTRFHKLWAKVLFCAGMLVLALAVYGALLTLLPESLASRFTIESVISSRGTYRLDTWIRAFKAMGREPYKLLFGFGNGSSLAVIGGRWVAHNFVIQLLLELGIVGSCLFYAFLWRWCRRLARYDSMCLSAMLGCMAISLTLSVNKVYYFWVIFILSIVCSKAKESPKKENQLT